MLLTSRLKLTLGLRMFDDWERMRKTEMRKRIFELLW